MNQTVDLAIIGGTGICGLKALTNTQSQTVYTPFGATSDVIVIGDFAGRRVAFLPRHGDRHDLPPHLVPYRANLWALKQLGVSRILAPCAVGSLQENVKCGDVVIPDQFIDWTKNRHYSFYDGGKVAHVSMAEPFCPQLRELAVTCAQELKLSHHAKGTTITIEGPRFSTRAESFIFKNVLKSDIIGMTLVPECILARELEMCYMSIAMVTDYDAWNEDVPDVTHAGVEQAMKNNIHTIKQLLIQMIPNIPTTRAFCKCGQAHVAA